MSANEYAKEYNEQVIDNNVIGIITSIGSSAPETQINHPPSTPVQLKLQYSRDEAAKILGIGLRTLDRFIANKQLTIRRMGRRVLISRDTLNQFVRRDHPTG
jgi:excisionase family DNA binding protein